MAHIPRTTIHAFQKRALTVLIDVNTTLNPGDLSSTEFQFGATTVSGLSPGAGGDGITIPVAMTASNLDITAGTYGWECRATIGGEVTVMAAGVMQVATEPTATA